MKNRHTSIFMRFLCTFFFFTFLGFSASAFAESAVPVASVPPNPVTLVQNSISALKTQIMQAGSANLAKNPKRLAAIMQDTIMPLVNINQMAGLALGPKWRIATPDQRDAFVKQFNLLLARNYTNAILDITDYTITLYPLRTDAWKTASTVSINGLVISHANGQSSHISYYLERVGNSWQIYDFAVEGVSFLKNYQAQFQSFPDMPTLIAKMTAMNAESVDDQATP